MINVLFVLVDIEQKQMYHTYFYTLRKMILWHRRTAHDLKKNQILKWTDKEMSSGAWHSRNCQSDLKTQVVLSEWELCIQDSLLENCISGITPCLKLQTDSFDLQKNDYWPDYCCHSSYWCESVKGKLKNETDYRLVQ